MAIITFDEWKNSAAQINAFRQSQALKEVTRRFEIYDQRQTLANLENLATAFQTWRTTNPSGEVVKLGTTVTNLAETIARAKQSNLVIVAKATNVGARGYSFVVDLDGDNPLPLNQHLPALSPSEIARINEAIARAKKAARLARDHMILLARKSAFATPLQAAEKLYVDYFGAYDAARVKEVRDNFTKLFDAFDAEPEVVDHRNTDFGEDCYAATHTKHLPKGTKVRVWMGRDFFIEGKARPRGVPADEYAKIYTKTSDATVGTLIHEFSHGVFHAVDAPPVKPDGNWRLQPDMTPGDDYGSSPDNDIQCSTRECDKRLAIKDATIAVRNADNYGQFACECLLAEVG